MKDFLKNKKKMIISIVCAVILIIIIAAIATRSFAENASIGKENAQNFAFVDAGVDPVEVEKLKTEFEFKNGQFVYEVEFETNGTEYDYWIKASNGSVIKKEVDSTDEIINQEEQKQNLQTNKNAQENQPNEKNQESVNNNNIIKDQTTENKGNNQTENKQNTNTNKSDIISLSTAKNKALSNANVSSSKATFTKTKLDYDDGIEMYDIEFYTSTNEYEYEINAKTGAIIKKEVEAIKNSSSRNSSTSSNSNSNNNSYIGVDKAKSIALNHAGVSDVIFEKAKLDRDDGKTIYEIEFYKDNIEYGYEIDAISGKIIDYDIDND